MQGAVENNPYGRCQRNIQPQQNNSTPLSLNGFKLLNCFLLAPSQANEFVSWAMAKKLRYEVGTTPAADVNYRIMAKAKRSSGKTNDSSEQFTGIMLNRGRDRRELCSTKGTPVGPHVSDSCCAFPPVHGLSVCIGIPCSCRYVAFGTSSVAAKSSILFLTGLCYFG